ncbi:hypothetical protein Bhyg_10484 [Pseudolycoriella hygida]|uniref:Uncharacterized protein n=1 Tax=Pseudolycoriella hygida TaxID=35572 RepID=A0A9Q0RZA2_9DIPT|nr:hypothetical protein Bhyg_10484 [Pseudolycoriella hygida]
MEKRLSSKSLFNEVQLSRNFQINCFFLRYEDMITLILPNPHISLLPTHDMFQEFNSSNVRMIKWHGQISLKQRQLAFSRTVYKFTMPSGNANTHFIKSTSSIFAVSTLTQLEVVSEKMTMVILSANEVVDQLREL